LVQVREQLAVRQWPPGPRNPPGGLRKSFDFVKSCALQVLPSHGSLYMH